VRKLNKWKEQTGRALTNKSTDDEDFWKKMGGREKKRNAPPVDFIRNPWGCVV